MDIIARASEAAYYLLYRHFDDLIKSIQLCILCPEGSCEILNSDSHLQREKNAAVLLKAIDRLSLRKLAGDEPAETIPPKSDGTPMDWNRPDHKTQICKWIRTEYSKKGKANKAGVIRAALVHFGLPSEYERGFGLNTTNATKSEPFLNFLNRAKSAKPYPYFFKKITL
jgi:hypothetical protein